MIDGVRPRSKPGARPRHDAIDRVEEGPDPGGHWRANRVATGLLLCLWFSSTFLVAWFAPVLDWDFFGWRMSYYLSAQGAPLVCLGIVVFYAWYMRRVDRRNGLDESDDP